jgi:hypothetical protein
MDDDTHKKRSSFQLNAQDPLLHAIGLSLGVNGHPLKQLERHRSRKTQCHEWWHKDLG